MLLVALLLCGKLLLKQRSLKFELLFQEALLETMRKATASPRANQGAQDCGSSTGKENDVCHKSVATTPNVELRDGVGSRLSQPKETSK